MKLKDELKQRLHSLDMSDRKMLTWALDDDDSSFLAIVEVDLGDALVIISRIVEAYGIDPDNLLRALVGVYPGRQN